MFFKFATNKKCGYFYLNFPEKHDILRTNNSLSNKNNK